MAWLGVFTVHGNERDRLSQQTKILTPLNFGAPRDIGFQRAAVSIDSYAIVSCRVLFGIDGCHHWLAERVADSQKLKSVLSNFAAARFWADRVTRDVLVTPTRASAFDGRCAYCRSLDGSSHRGGNFV